MNYGLTTIPSRTWISSITRQPDALGDPALDLALDGERVERLAHVLGRGDLDDADEAELDVDVDHRAVRGEGEREVRVALAVLVQRHGAPRAVLAGLLDGLGEQVGHRS